MVNGLLFWEDAASLCLHVALKTTHNSRPCSSGFMSSIYIAGCSGRCSTAVESGSHAPICGHFHPLPIIFCADFRPRLRMSQTADPRRGGTASRALKPFTSTSDVLNKTEFDGHKNCAIELHATGFCISLSWDQHTPEGWRNSK